MDAIKTVNLTKIYKDTTAVDSINLTVKKGEFFALLGVNGAGKSTTVNMLSCLIVPTSGDAFVNSHSILKDTAAVKKITNVSPQETAVAPKLTVYENIDFMGRIYGFSKEESAIKTHSMINAFGLEKVENKKAKKLSGGMQRRLSIAMALVSEPEILFMDEPTLGLDVIARREMWENIAKLKGQTTVILTTHYLEEAQQLCDRIAIMADGRIKAIGTAQEIMDKAGTPDFESAFIKTVEGDIKQ